MTQEAGFETVSGIKVQAVFPVQSKLETIVSEDSELFTQAVYAVRGTCGAKVLAKIKEINAQHSKNGTLHKRLNILYELVDSEEEAGIGLLIADRLIEGKSFGFSGRYEYCQNKDQYLIKIGPKSGEQGERIIRHAAYEILAMLKRGICTWTIKNETPGSERTCRTAYGSAPKLRKPGDPNAWREKHKADKALRWMHV